MNGGPDLRMERMLRGAKARNMLTTIRVKRLRVWIEWRAWPEDGEDAERSVSQEHAHHYQVMMLRGA